MSKLINRGARGFGLPMRTRKNESVAAFMLHSGASCEVPAWYVDELRKEPGVAALFASEQLRVEDAPEPKTTEPKTDPKEPKSNV
jgi:hypothetical protein